MQFNKSLKVWCTEWCGRHGVWERSILVVLTFGSLDSSLRTENNQGAGRGLHENIY